ncbi:unnamed protein product [Brassicogethes aeneus]|uniref:BZIP domain-containing protein n=1 Tax=Brassicogethes aeneus TaxID=1431903 RepID=A0A9P0BCC9_BRAAE|nr:unnamed protein product [Brassicogethes aeneus]
MTEQMDKINTSPYAITSLLTTHAGYLPFHPLCLPPVMDNVMFRPQPFSYCCDASSVTSSVSPKSQSDSDNQDTPARPFKMYSNDPRSMSMILPTETILTKNSEDAYAEFREKILQKNKTTNSNKNIKRSPSSSVSDPHYLEKRKRNNEAAKKSRDARKAKEDEIAIRCAFLEKENLHLKIKIATLENERDRLHSMVYR